MITAEEALAIASEHNYEKTIRNAAKLGHMSVSLSFASEDLAVSARDTLIANGFICSKTRTIWGRDGTVYIFECKWEKKGI